MKNTQRLEEPVGGGAEAASAALQSWGHPWQARPRCFHAEITEIERLIVALDE